jgi:ribosome-associated protein
LETAQIKELAMQALDLVCLEIREISSFADFMIVVTGTSNRHVQSLAEEVSKKIKEAGGQPPRMEGEDLGEWVLLDMGDVVVHVMQAETRKLYDLESLWSMGNVRET